MLALKVAVIAFILYWLSRYLLNALIPIYSKRNPVILFIACIGAGSIFVFVGALLWAVFNYGEGA